jgi:fumarate reductase flavoprotein subunit
MVMGSWYYCGITLPQVPGIFINHDGKRYAAESIGYSFSAYEMFQQPFGQAYYVIDSVGVENTHLFGDQFVSGSEGDTSRIILHQADTIEELAIKMNCDPSVLKGEIDRYNGFVAKGVDEDFNKVMDGTTLLSTPPFYALLEISVPYNTYGGIKTDVDSHVLNAKGEPIPGLYAAGSCCGSYAEQEGLYYTGGVVQAMTFGRQAGKHAAAEEVWDA